MGPKKGGKGKGKGKGKGGGAEEAPSGPTPAELQAQIADLTTMKLKEEQDRNTMQLERVIISLSLFRLSREQNTVWIW